MSLDRASVYRRWQYGARQGKPAVSKQELDNLSGGPKETHTVTFRVTSTSP